MKFYDSQDSCWGELCHTTKVLIGVLIAGITKKDGLVLPIRPFSTSIPFMWETLLLLYAAKTQIGWAKLFRPRPNLAIVDNDVGVIRIRVGGCPPVNDLRIEIPKG